MLISINWLRDFVDLPAELDAQALAERFTICCAEVEGIEPVTVNALGLIAAKIVEIGDVPENPKLRRVTLDTGSGGQVQTVTAAPKLHKGWSVVYAPPGASVASLGAIGEAKVAGLDSVGMILPADALGIELGGQEAVHLAPDSVHGRPGAALPSELFDDWIIEVDNKSITHRPDLWGHYGIAREMAAIFGVEIKPYAVEPIEAIRDVDLPELPIEIDDPALCRRYTGLVLQRVPARPAPLWMQLRLGHVGLRPIDCLVDLTNYIMLELGQPMHAFDGDRVDRIEVGLGEAGSKFRTLDDIERTLPDSALMILSDRKPVALAGIMGGAETEIGPETQSLLLESANFEAAVIRRCATALGHRTDASARFEKSLDPVNTVLAIQRFVLLARNEWPDLAMASKLSDCHPQPAEPISVEIDPAFVSRFMGHAATRDDIRGILEPLGFGVSDAGDKMRIDVPSWRATKDISIEADIIEEIARYVGYNNIEPVLPEVTVRSYAPNALHELEQRTLKLWCLGMGYSEIHGYIWANGPWSKALGYEAGEAIRLRNAMAEGNETLRRVLMPGMLASAERNRHHLETFRLFELGGVYPTGKADGFPGCDAGASASKPGDTRDREWRRFAVISCARKKGAEDDLLAELRGQIDTWCWQALGRPASYGRADKIGGFPWAHPQKTANVLIDGQPCGLVGVAPLGLRRTMDEHLAGWSMAWAEIGLDGLVELPRIVRKLQPIPEYPEKDLDFTVVVAASDTYETLGGHVAAFGHPLLRRVSFVTSFEGKSLGADKRSLTFRARIGSNEKTLVDEEINGFRQAFQRHLEQHGMALRGE